VINLKWSNIVSNSMLLLKSNADGNLYKFQGKSIPNICVVMGAERLEDDDVKYTEYSLALPDYVKIIPLCLGYKTFCQEIGNELGGGQKVLTWDDVSRILGVSDSVAREFLNTHFFSESQALDKVERELNELREAEKAVSERSSKEESAPPPTIKDYTLPVL